MVSPTIGDAFGQERVVRASARLLQERGAEVFFLGDRQTGELPPGTAAELIPGLSSLHTLSPWREVRQRHQQALQFLQTVRPDVVHLVDQFDFRLERALCRHYPVVLTAHSVSPTCPASTRLIRGDSVCGERSGWRCAWNHHRYGCLSYLKNDGRRLHAIHNYLLKRRALSGARFAIAISRYLQDLLVRDGWPADRVALIYNPVPPRPVTAPRPDAPEGLIVCAARLVGMKGIDRLLRAVAGLKAKRWALWICGDGGARASLEQLARESGIGDRVRFLGRLGYAEMGAVMAAARCVAQPNLGPEGFGLSVAEASSMGVPVVSFRVPALDEIVADGETGILVPPHDVAALTLALDRALTDEALLARCRQRGPELMRERFSPQAHAEQTWRLYERCRT
jgi:glycosyltransferase involved in cell wall biosynthesis